MWTCPYCGGKLGQPFEDSQLRGMLCLSPDCGRFDASEDGDERLDEWDVADL